MSRSFIVSLAALTALATITIAAPLPNGSDSVDAIPMTGPFATLDDYCKSIDADVKTCLAPPKCGTTAGVGKLAGAFVESRVLPGCEVALKTAKGWYVLSTQGLPAWASFLNNGDRYQSEVTSIAASKDAKSVLVRGTFVHDTNAAKMLWLAKPPDASWYECEDRLFVCSVGASGPGCAGPFAVSFTAYCRDGEHVERAMKRPEPHDFKFMPELAGTTLAMKSPSATQPRTAPLPGWAVIAIDAQRLKDVTRPLSPEKVELHFP